MPKDNEVDEKARPVAWIVTNGGESCEPWLEYEQSEVDALPAVCIAEPLYSAATVAELRAEVERLRAERQASLGVGDGSGQLIVHGKYDSIKECQRKLLAGEAAERRVRELEAALSSCIADMESTEEFYGPHPIAQQVIADAKTALTGAPA